METVQRVTTAEDAHADFCCEWKGRGGEEGDRGATGKTPALFFCCLREANAQKEKKNEKKNASRDGGGGLNRLRQAPIVTA